MVNTDFMGVYGEAHALVICCLCELNVSDSTLCKPVPSKIYGHGGDKDRVQGSEEHRLQVQGGLSAF